MGLLEFFDVIVTADDVSASKPDPSCYSLATMLLKKKFPEKDIQPGNCVAIEDTPQGIQAAQGAGLKTIGITHTHAGDELAQADRIIKAFGEPASLLDIN